ncbi:MAG: delta 1-pyrroline-5-carboxylate synthetase [Nitrososphaeria archaeon]|nr:delta 1-pyrroline-5-carboxylate synthetase [Nitrososphaeria archaeon]NIN51602.1 delta 1-pyrroline-5-carboxylate synthetase [Nitrososphaeria archaeon]NIQ32087.1 delta 1-pyrroline-5-carboxylate synthetase [Nitrososphaeria archaeon]
MEAVLKLGGSLAEDPVALKDLCAELGRLAKDHRILIVPGGGRFADLVREMHQRFLLSDPVSHKMAILAMDQMGYILTDLIQNAQEIYVTSEAEELSRKRMLPVLLPSRLLLGEAPLEASWDVTSDSIAAYVAILSHAEKLILITDVDGIYKIDPKEYTDAELLRSISAVELLNLKRRTSVDRYLPKILLKKQLECYVVNGRHPERVRAILRGEKTLCTEITIS